MYKLRTVDVWDTLLRRDCHPECIKLATAMYLFLGFFGRLKPNFSNHWDLYRARVDTERHLAGLGRSEGRDDEYEITCVLKHWLDMVFSSSAEESLSTQLAEFELRTEIERSFIDSEIIEFLLPHQAEHTLFLSDFYMTSAMLHHLLSAKGVDAFIEDGISSCDLGINKRSGKLFRHVQALYGVSPAEHIHIGDNQWSDIESPRKLGITALHFQPETEHAKRLERERLLSSREALFEHIRREASAHAEHVGSGMPDRQNAAFQFGAEAAPLFIGFALWIAEQAAVAKLDRIYFLTREGEFFHLVYSALFPNGKFFGHTLPPSNVLAVSRLATFVASMQNVSIEEMSRVWDLFKLQSVSGLFSTLGLDIEAFETILEEVGLERNEVIENPQHNLAIKRLFQTEKFVSAVKISIRYQKDLVLGYLAQNDLPLCNRNGIIDIGWRGSIQDNLAILMPDNHLHGMYLGLRQVINPQPANVSKSAYCIDENKSFEFCDLFENFAVMELLCSSSKGSVVGYRCHVEQIIPRRQDIDEENSAYEHFIRYFQEGVLLAAQHWQPYLERYVVTGDELRETALHIWKTLCRTPSRGITELFMQTPQHDVFGFGDLFRRNQLPTLSTIFLAPVSRSRRRQLIEFIRRVQWSAAIDHVQGVGRFHRGILALIFRLANHIRHVRIRIRMRRAKPND